MSDNNGRVLVAVAKARVVGVAHAYFQTRHDAWLEGVRVHRDYRGRGIAGILNRALVEYAIGRGATVARLCTGQDNTASQKHLTKTGFKLSQAYSRYASKRPLKRVPAGVSKVTTYDRTLWSHVTGSREYKDYQGLYADGWTWYPLGRQVLRKLVQDGKVFRVSRGLNMIKDGFSILLRDEKGVTVAYISGSEDQVLHLGRYFRAKFISKSRGRVRIIVPSRTSLEGIVRRAGYVRTGETLLYEKRLLQ